MKKLFFIVLWSQSLWAQNYMDVYKKIADKYMDASTLKVELTVNIKYVESFEKGNTSFKGMILKKEKEMFTEFDNKLNITAEGKNIFIDKATRTIMVSRSQYDEKLVKKHLFAGFEEEAYLKEYDFNFSGENNGLLVFNIVPLKQENVYTNILLELNKDYSFRHIVYTMNPAEGNMVSSIEINYTLNDFNTGVDKGIFSLDQYISTSRNTYIGTGIYSGFKVIDHEKIQKKNN